MSQQKMQTSTRTETHKELETVEGAMAKLDSKDEQHDQEQLFAQCRLLTRRWAETDAQLQACRRDADDHLSALVDLRRQMNHLEREVNQLRRGDALPQDVEVHSEQLESEEMKTVRRFLNDLATYRGNESGMPKKLRAALEARIQLVVRNADRFSHYITGRTPSSTPDSCPVIAKDTTVVPDSVSNDTADTTKTIIRREDDVDDVGDRSLPVYHCHINLMPFHHP